MAEIIRDRDYKIDAESGCWLWIRAINGTGYGAKAIGGVTHNAHRASWLLMVGDIPEGHVVRHIDTCLNRHCVNPDHLVLGTQADNMTDKARLLRAGKKLTPDQVVEIRERKARGEYSRVVAADYGVRHNTVDRIWHGISWPYAGGPTKLK